MYNNSYIGNQNQFQGQYYPNYTPSYNYQQMPVQQESPFTDVRYGTIDEAKAYIVTPMKSVMFINRDKGEFYVKTADNMGKSTVEEYKYTKLENNPTESKSFDFEAYLKREEAKNVFATREDITNINLKLEEIKKQLNIDGGKTDE